ncbi:MAG: hypothetical protein KDA37_17340 [Planctomycetales bacterium]|nr:hypothetical protein [Planctomycetales bacterium]
MATSRAIAAIKRTKVVEAVAAGATYDEAAEQAGYASRSGAYKALWRALGDRAAEAVDEHRAIELARLDALQAALWERAMTGDVKAAGMVLRIIEQRTRLLGLDKPTVGCATQTLVMSPAESAVWKETQGRETGKPRPRGVSTG